MSYQSVPSGNAAAITANDTTVIPDLRSIYVGTGGNLQVKFNGTTVLFKNVPSGAILPIAPTIVMSTNTTAADLVGLK